MRRRVTRRRYARSVDRIAPKVRGDWVEGKTVLGELESGQIDEVLAGGSLYRLTSGKLITHRSLEELARVEEQKQRVREAAETRRSAGAGYETRGVLAARYRGRALEERALLTHALLPERLRSLCGRIREEGLSDVDEGTVPSCPACLERLEALERRVQRRRR